MCGVRIVLVALATTGLGCGARTALVGGRAPAVDGGADATPDADPCGNADRDGDGHAAVRCGGDDCDDCDPRVHPGAPDDPEAPWIVEAVDPAFGPPGRFIDLALDAEGRPHVAFCGEGEIRIATRRDDGWTVEAVGTPCQNPSILIDPEGATHVLYEREGELRWVTDAFGDWVAETVDAETGAGRYSDVVVDESGTLHVAYSRWRSFLGYELRYAWRTGGKWQIGVVDEERDSGWNPVLVLDGAGAPNVVYCRYVDGEPGAVLHARLANEAWEIETIDSGRQVGSHPSAVLDDAGNLVASYYANDAAGVAHQGVFVATRGPGGWTREPVASGSRVGMWNAIARGRCGIHLAWMDDASPSLRHATNATGRWVQETAVDGIRGAYLRIALDPEGLVHAAYRPGESALYWALRPTASGIDEDCDGADG